MYRYLWLYIDICAVQQAHLFNCISCCYNTSTYIDIYHWVSLSIATTNYLSLYVITYPYISYLPPSPWLNTAMHRCIWLFITTCHYTPLYNDISVQFVIYRYVSLFTIIYRYMSLCTIIQRQVSAQVVIYRFVSLYIALYRNTSLFIVTYVVCQACLLGMSAYRYLPSCIIVYNYVSLYIALYRYISLLIVIYHYISLSILIWL